MTEPMDALMEGLEKLGQEELYGALIATTRTLNESWIRLNVTIPRQLEEEGNDTRNIP